MDSAWEYNGFLTEVRTYKEKNIKFVLKMEIYILDFKGELPIIIKSLAQDKSGMYYILGTVFNISILKKELIKVTWSDK